MNAIKMLLFIVLLLLPTFAHAGQTIIIEGRIGDYSPKARVFEIKGKMYQLPPDIPVMSLQQRELSLSHLKGGKSVKIIGEKIVSENGKERTIYQQVILLN